jgi:magnesium transporter
MASEPDVSDSNALSSVAPRDIKVPRSVHVNGDGALQRDLHPNQLVQALRAGSGVLWVDVDSTQRSQHAVLEKVFQFHPLAIEDTLNPESRVKLEEYDGYLFTIIRGVRFDESTDDPYDYRTLNLCFFLGPNYLVTVHDEPSFVCAEIWDRLMRSPDLLQRGAARLQHTIMDESIDAYFPVLEQVDEFIEGLEAELFERERASELRSIFSVKRLVLSLRRHLGPQREIFQALSNRPQRLVPLEVQLYYRDIYDHVLRINDAFETQRDLLSSTLETYLSKVSNQLGQVTKGLALVATLSIPFVVVSGMWGMNFEHVPLSGTAGGFWILLVSQLVLGVVLVALLRYFRWL